MHKRISLYITIVIYSIQSMISQTAFHNFGEIQIHDEGQVGFHTHLINDGVFDNNLGLAGFYGDTQLNVSGLTVAEFFNAEIDVPNGLNLETSLGVYNNLDFISGKVITPRNNINISLDFLQATYSGETDDEYVDGYASLFGNIDFSFPIGHTDRLRPLSISQPNSITTFKSAYFFEDPNTPTTFATTFNTASFSPTLSKVSDIEFWDLNGDQEVEVTLTWDNDSEIQNLTEDINLLRVVGWNESTLIWENLGKNTMSGDLDNGSITSLSFIPDNYIVLTIASGPISPLVNGFSPNGDGVNDVFELTGIDLTQENTIEIYDRWGSVIYIKNNYDNSWGGISENRNTFDKGELVPAGTYFYFLKVKDKVTNREKVYKGWVYINY